MMFHQLTKLKTVGWFENGAIKIGKVIKKIDGKTTLVKTEDGEQIPIKNYRLREIRT